MPARPFITRLCKLLVGALAAITAVVGLAGTAAAQSSDLAIRVQVRDQQRDEQGRPDNQPVVGVTIRLLDADGNEIAEGVTDDQGVVIFPVPERADYTVILDEDTLPDDLALAANSSAEQAIGRDSFITATRAVTFLTGQSQSVGQSTFEKVMQRLADGIRFGLVIAMCSVGLSLLFGTTGLTNFAYGELVAFGALVTFFLNVTGIGLLSFLPLIDDQGRFQLFLAIPIAVAVGGLFGWLNDWVIFARLRRRGIGLITQMVVTVGLSILLRNVYLIQFGGQTRPLRQYTVQKGIDIGPVTITPRDLITTIISLIVLLLVGSALQYTRMGKAVRAVSDNPSLASATGINSELVIRLVWVAGGALAALGGIFRAMDEEVGYDMGSRLLFLMFAGITLGGLGSAFGALVGGFFVGVFVEMATFVVPSELKNTPALAILILVLLLRPQGILGRRDRIG